MPEVRYGLLVATGLAALASPSVADDGWSTGTGGNSARNGYLGVTGPRVPALAWQGGLPAAFARMWSFAQEGRLAEGRDLYRRLAPLREAYAMAGGQAPVVKRLLDRAGLCGGSVRPPARGTSEAVDEHIEAFVAALATEGLWPA